MKRAISLAILATATLAMADAMMVSTRGPVERLDSWQRDGERTDSLFFFEDFESGWNGWETIDITAVEPAWNINSEGAYDGNSWWSGDPEIGGYDNHWLHYLETPVIDLTGTSAPELSFYLDYTVEPPGGEPDGYDAWDGGNVWIKVDDGEWMVADGFTGHPYNATSLYSFGEEFGMGTGIAGWANTSGGYNQAMLDLSSYIGSEVQFRFAFCSDPGASTVDGGNSSWFGFRFDDILIMDADTTLLSNNADDAPVPSEFTLVNGEEASGDWWELTTDYAHSPTTAAKCSVFPNLRNGLTTPWLTLEDGWEYWIQWWLISDLRDFNGSGGTSLEDYFRIEVQIQGSIEWTYLLHDYCDVGRPGYNDDPNNLAWDEYDPLEDPFNDGTASLTDYAGETVRLRIVVITDDNDDGGTGAGLLIDDFQLWGSDVLANDLGVTQTILSFPRTQGVPAEIGVELTNFGGEAAANVLTWVDVDDSHVGFVNPRFNVDPLSSDWGVIEWTPNAVGDVDVKSYSVFDDQNTVNDTLYTEWTLAAPGDVTFGYYYHGDEISWIIPAEEGEGPFGFFDLGAVEGEVELDMVEVVMGDNDTQHSGNQVVIHTYADDNGAPGAELSTDTYDLTNNQTGAILYEWGIGPVTVEGGVWIWIELVDGFPDPIGHDLLDFNTGHYGIGDGMTWDTSLSEMEGGANSLYFFVHGEATGTSVRTPTSIPNDFALGEAYPNPFNPSTRIDFTAPADQLTTLKVYNLAGQEVATVFSGAATGAVQSATFDAGHLASGVYLTELVSGEQRASSKLLLVK